MVIFVSTSIPAGSSWSSILILLCVHADRHGSHIVTAIVIPILAPHTRLLIGRTLRDRNPVRHQIAVFASTYHIARLIRLGLPRAHRRPPWWPQLHHRPPLRRLSAISVANLATSAVTATLMLNRDRTVANPLTHRICRERRLRRAARSCPHGVDARIEADR